MLSGKLIHVVESNCGPITLSALQQIHRDNLLTHISSLPEAELRDWGHEILQNLGESMVRDCREELTAHYESLGKLRYLERVPLSEAVAGLCVLKQKTFEFVRAHANAQNAAEFYAQGEFEAGVGRFFDFLICNVVRGYEEALRHAAYLEPRAAYAGSTRR